MKKLLYTLCIGFMFICSVSVSAGPTKYQPNVFTDETTIEEDFKNLGIDINDYYKPKNYNYEKWYVIGMSEGYVNTDAFDIQTYFYLYNPFEYGTKNNYMSTVASINLTYKIGEHGQERTDASGTKLDYNKEHLIYKVKGFTYSFTERSEIYITQIQHYNFYGSGITSDSGFKAVANHSKLNGFQVELSFNSTIIIDELECISLDVLPEDNFGNWFFNLSFKEVVIDNIIDKKLRLYFYNFNFPKSIQPDSIEYAKFSYYKENWEKERKHVGSTAIWHWDEVRNEKISEEHVISEYFPGTHKFQVGKYSEELEFETFVLGNRIEKEQHGYLQFSEEQKKSFDYDCSILLDNEYVIVRDSDGGTASYSESTNYTKLRDIDFLELWYKKDGIVFKCQVVSQAPEDEYKGEVGSHKPKSKSWWDLFLEFLVEMFDFIFFGMFSLSFWIPDIAKQIFSGIILFVIVFYVIPCILKWVIKIIRILFGRE